MWSQTVCDLGLLESWEINANKWSELYLYMHYITTYFARLLSIQFYLYYLNNPQLTLCNLTQGFSLVTTRVCLGDTLLTWGNIVRSNERMPKTVCYQNVEVSLDCVYIWNTQFINMVRKFREKKKTNNNEQLTARKRLFTLTKTVTN